MVPGKIGAIKALVKAAVELHELAAPAIPVVNEKLQKLQEQRKKKAETQVYIPPLYDKGFALGLVEVTDELERLGFRVMTSKMRLQDANPRLRNCFDGQVLGSTPSHKRRVDRGSTIVVRYITQEVIDESRRLYEETERLKQEKLRRRKEKLEQTKSKAKDVVRRKPRVKAAKPTVESPTDEVLEELHVIELPANSGNEK